MATDFTQDAVLYFLQSNGGSVKNADLIYHFRNFIRNHEDQKRNRELFKKFVNSVATVTQIDGVCHVVLKSKYKGHVPGVGTGLPAGNYHDSSPVNANRNPAVGADKPRQKPQWRDEAVPAPAGDTEKKTILPSAGIMLSEDKTQFYLYHKRVPEVSIAPELISRPGPAQVDLNQRPERKTQLPGPDQSYKGVHHRLGSGPHPGSSQQMDLSQRPEKSYQFPDQSYRLGSGPPPGPVQPVYLNQTPDKKSQFPYPDQSHRGVQHRRGSGPFPNPSPPVDLNQRPERSYQFLDQSCRLGSGAPPGPVQPVDLFQRPEKNSQFPDPDQSYKGGKHKRGSGPPLGPSLQMDLNQRPEKTSFSQFPDLDQSYRGTQHRRGSGPPPGPVQPVDLNQRPDKNSQFPDLDQSYRGTQHRRGSGPPPGPVQPVDLNQRPDKNSQFPDLDQSYRGGKHRRGSGPPPGPSLQMDLNQRPEKTSFSQYPDLDQSYRGTQHRRGSGPFPDPVQPVDLNQRPEKKSKFPGPDQSYRPGSGPPPGPSPQVSVPEPVRSREVPARTEDDINPPLLRRRFRNRKSYKSAVSEDDDDDNEDEVPPRPVSVGGMWPLNVARSETGSSSVISSSLSSEEKLPQIYIQNTEVEVKAPRGPSEGDLRRQRHRRSYKSAVSEDDDDDEDDVQPRPCSVGGMQPLNVARRETGSSSVISSSSSSAEEKLPQIYIQNTEGEVKAPRGPSERDLRRRRPGAGAASVPDELMSARRSPPSEASRPPSGPLAWSSSSEGLQTIAGEPEAIPKIQEEVQQLQEAKPESMTHRADGKTSIPRHHSADNLHDDQCPTAPMSARHRSSDQLDDVQQFLNTGMRLHVSTGDLCDDHRDAESSEDSISSPGISRRPTVARRVSSRLRSRMCHSLGDDLDQFLQGERSGGGNEADRLHRISSSLSLRYNLSSSSLSSCATPPRCPSPDPAGSVEEKRSRERRSNTPTAHHVGQSQVPLEPSEHAWIVKAATGAWPIIYLLLREDPSLLNKQDFISGFTVLHWIAKHGDHRVLNTMWDKAKQAGLFFNINTQSKSGQTPLHIAAIHSNKNIIRLLVKKFKADVRIRDMAGKRPWQYLSPPSLEILEILGAPLKAALTGVSGQGRVVMDDCSRQPQKQRRRHHFSSASPGMRSRFLADMSQVKRSTSIAALLKHKSLHRFQGHQSDASV